MRPSILVPYDFSAASERALGWAVDLLRASGGGTLRLCHVVNPVPVAAAVAPVVLPMITDEQLREIEEGMRTAVQRHGYSATCDVVLSPAAGDVIVDTARKQGCTLVVMGTHGRGGVSRALLGSVADWVVRHADCPVVTMRDTTATPPAG